MSFAKWHFRLVTVEPNSVCRAGLESTNIDHSSGSDFLVMKDTAALVQASSAAVEEVSWLGQKCVVIGSEGI